MRKNFMTLSVMSLLFLAPYSAHAAGDHAGHAMAEHGGNAMESAKSQGMTKGVLHTVDVANSKVNLTHDPIQALGWPKMTMDLPVTKRVKLGKFKAGDKVMFTVKKGRDNQFRIIKMSVAH
ncbi:copper-binding protein [Magnetococcus sp. PR-3]|uniref:copper-binding protein n=1 Tax=Magnetococcus sp. PR-3 TaxID=3120355 RepID=UPI002FCE3A18